MFNSTAHAIDALTQADHGTKQLTWAAGPSFALSATATTLSVLGQSISGDMTVTVSSRNVQATFANVNASFGGGLLSLTGGAGRSCSSSGAGTYGVVSGHRPLGVSGASFSGTLGSASTRRPPTQTVTGVSLPAQTVQITATSALLMVAGQSIGGNFTIAATTAGATQASIAVTGLTLSSARSSTSRPPTSSTAR